MSRGGGEDFLLASGGGQSIFLVQSAGSNLCPPDVGFISDDHVINATSLITVENESVLALLLMPLVRCHTKTKIF